METFIARQPIFDLHQKIYGYELLFRSSFDNFFRHPDPNQASSKVLADSFFLMGIQLLTGGKRAFINITREMLVQDYLFLIPKDRVVVEVLETVTPDAEVVAACRKLKRAGYLLALDDFTWGESWEPLVQLADFMKIDFLSAGKEERESLIRRFSSSGIHFLAEKVETQEAFREASQAGYRYFQGYFFSKPRIISGKDISGFKAHYLRILQEIHHPELDFHQMEELIKREISISYRLLRYINSAFFGLRSEISSILQAMVLLGEKEIRKWISLILLAAMGEDKPEELVVQAVIRAKFCELMAHRVGLDHRGEDLFLMGMFSLLDAILDRPLPELLLEIPIAKDVKEALLGNDGPLGDIYQSILNHERGDWDGLCRRLNRLGVDEAIVSRAYVSAVEWGYRCFQE